MSVPVAAVLAVVPSYNSITTLPAIVDSLIAIWPCELHSLRVLIVDDGSTDETRHWQPPAGAAIIRHQANRGKGAALRTGFVAAQRLGAKAVVSVDSDGQHFAEDAVRLATHPADLDALLLGCRELTMSGAPKPNIVGNRVSNFFLSILGGRSFSDTQCGLRRYPLTKVLAADVRAERYAYEAELLLRAAREGWTIEELPVSVHYAKAGEHRSHYRAFKDTAHITARIIKTALTRQ